MVIQRWLVRRREHALSRWDSEMQYALMLIGHAMWRQQAIEVRRARAWLRLWDWALDLWTREGRR